MSQFSGSEMAQVVGQLKSKHLPQGVEAQWVTLAEDKASATVEVPFITNTAELTEQLQQLAPEIQWHVRCKVAKMPNSQPELPKHTGNVILVSSGKGGVGKSSVSVSLALALQQLGANVGLLDADIYGPSIPTMLGQTEQPPEVDQRNKMQPLERHGIWVNSLGYLVADDDAAIWRGPMASRALQQLYNDTKWPNVDYLIVDMPPGTGDIQLTMAQTLPVTAAVVVTTPQTVALKDAEKGIVMFNKLNIPLLGVIENMSYYQCSNCGHKDAIFGSRGGADIAASQQVDLLGQWPLTTAFRDSLDHHQPLVVSEPEHELSQLVLDSAAQLAANLYYQTRKNV